MDELKKILGDELFGKVTTLLNGKKLIIDDGMVIPKHRFDCINISLREHKQKVIELLVEIENLKAELIASHDLQLQNKKLCKENEVLTQLLKEKIIQQLKETVMT